MADIIEPLPRVNLTTSASFVWMSSVVDRINLLQHRLDNLVGAFLFLSFGWILLFLLVAFIMWRGV